jgi:hypothetical protein
VARLVGSVASLVATALLVVASGCGAPDAGSGEPSLRVLFVGNSLIATNDLPAEVEAIAAEAGQRPVESRMVAPGGVSLEEHWRSTGARDALDEGRWDAVVLQQGPSSLPENRAHLRSWARRWADEARARGVRPALLGVWPESERSSAFGATIASYADAADAARSTLLPVGAAWQAAWRRDPELPLYGPDGFHPSELGTVLAALVVYAGLTGAATQDLPVPVDGPTARILREAAAEALAGARRHG